MIKLEREYSTEEVAEIFANSGSDVQAKFFHEIGTHMWSTWSVMERDHQFIAITKEISSTGANFIYALANWMKVKGIKGESPKFEQLAETYPEQR